MAKKPALVLLLTKPVATMTQILAWNGHCLNLALQDILAKTEGVSTNNLLAKTSVLIMAKKKKGATETLFKREPVATMIQIPAWNGLLGQQLKIVIKEMVAKEQLTTITTAQTILAILLHIQMIQGV